MVYTISYVPNSLSLNFTDSVNEIVNELSNKIDLPSTLLRAQALFRRFQRTVDAIDKKHNFPAPTMRPLKITDKPSAGGNESSQDPKRSTTTTATSADTARSSRGNVATSGSSIAAGKAKARAREDPERERETPQIKEKVISPELRSLFSKKPVVGNKESAVESGGGRVGS